MSNNPLGFSQLPGDPSFRHSSVNTVAVVPLVISSTKEGGEDQTYSYESFRNLFDSFSRHSGHAGNLDRNDLEVLLVVPNSSLPRPGDWRYDDTPLTSFHWQEGCQRLRLFDGRPEYSRLAHDRLMNHAVTREWIDLFPHRRTAAVVGVLNIRDCRDTTDLHRAEEVLAKWAERYSTPPYEVSAHGSSAGRDEPVKRLYIYDSFGTDVQNIDMTKSTMSSNSILAFPPTSEDHSQMMELHMNVVVNDLAVAVFLDLETKIRESNSLIGSAETSGNSRLRRLMTGNKESNDRGATANKLSVGSMAGLVDPDVLAIKPKQSSESDMTSKAEMEESSTMASTSSSPSQTLPFLLTPIDEYWNQSSVSQKDLESIRKRELSRRLKLTADLALLAGSPLDAYERYLKAAEQFKSGTPDPLWYACSLEGCAAAHIAMAEAGGFGVDDYLSTNFSLPADLLAVAKVSSKDEKSIKQVLPNVVYALCSEALNIVNRNATLGAYEAELLLKLAEYKADMAERHTRCRWGEGEGCHAGEQGMAPRWERCHVEVDDNKMKSDNPARAQSLARVRVVCELLHKAISICGIDKATRVDVAAHGTALCIKGIRVSAQRIFNRVHTAVSLTSRHSPADYLGQIN